MKTNQRGRMRRKPLGLAGHFGLLLLIFVTSACSSTPHKINLMPAPAVFADGAINPLPVGQPPVSYDNFTMLYATDRKQSENPEERPFYYNKAGFVVRLGRARVSAGNPGIQWEEARRITLASKRKRDFPLQVLSVQETDTLAHTDTFLTQLPEEASLPPGNGREFSRLVNQRLATSGVREIYI